jgi:hypothetical protein
MAELLQRLHYVRERNGGEGDTIMVLLLSGVGEGYKWTV